MSSILKITNKFDNKEYRVSIISTNKSISIPFEMNGLRLNTHEYNIIYQAAIYLTNKIPYKPLFVINFDKSEGISEWISEGEFINFVRQIILNEKIEDAAFNREVQHLIQKLRWAFDN